MEGPVRIAQQFPGQQDEIGLTVTNELVGLGWVGNKANGASIDVGLVADSFGEGDLKAGADRDLGVQDHASGGNVDQIDSAVLEGFRQFDRLVRVPPAFSPIGGRNSNEQRFLPDGADRVHYFDEEAYPVPERTAVAIRAPVGQRREEFVQQVAVGSMDLDDAKTGLSGATGCGDKGVPDSADARRIERDRHRVLVGEWHGAGGHNVRPAAFIWLTDPLRLPGDLHARLSARVGQLNAGMSTLRVDEIHNTAQAWNVFSLPDAEIFGGLHLEPGRHLKKVFEEQYDEMVLVRDIAFNSMCEHHLLPFMGKAHVGYIPRGKVTGLSKLARVVDEVARRPQVQERMTHMIADLIENELAAKGVIVVIEAEHTCMTIRGVKKPGALTVTSAVRGLFRNNLGSRAEAMALINGKH